MKTSVMAQLAAWVPAGGYPGKIAVLGAFLALSAWPADLRLGIIGTDTSHATEFTKMLNDASSPNHVAGAHVVAAFKGGSKGEPDSYRAMARSAEDLKTKYQIEFVPDIAGLCAK